MADAKPQQQVRITRSEIPTPTLDNPAKITLQVQSQVGMLPPRFLYFDKAQWTKEREAAAIKADMTRVMQSPGEIISI